MKMLRGGAGGGGGRGGREGGAAASEIGTPTGPPYLVSHE